MIRSPLFSSHPAGLQRTASHSAADSGLVHSLVLPPAPLQTRPAPDLADRLDLTFNVHEDGPVTVSLQPLVNERPQHHLKAHRALEFARRLDDIRPWYSKDIPYYTYIYYIMIYIEFKKKIDESGQPARERRERRVIHLAEGLSHRLESTKVHWAGVMCR